MQSLRPHGGVLSSQRFHTSAAQSSLMVISMLSRDAVKRNVCVEFRNGSVRHVTEAGPRRAKAIKKQTYLPGRHPRGGG